MGCPSINRFWSVGIVLSSRWIFYENIYKLMYMCFVDFFFLNVSKFLNTTYRNLLQSNYTKKSIANFLCSQMFLRCLGEARELYVTRILFTEFTAFWNIVVCGIEQPVWCRNRRNRSIHTRYSWAFVTRGQAPPGYKANLLITIPS